MPKCEVCDKQFHACGSCGLETWEWDYCSLKCYKEGRAPIEKEIEEFLQTLSIESKKRLLCFTEEWEQLLFEKLEEAINGSK